MPLASLTRFSGRQIIGLGKLLIVALEIIQNDCKTKNPHQINDEDFLKKGDDILSHITAVPSAQAGLTTLFGMGRGEPRRNNHLKVIVGGCWFMVAGVSRATNLQLSTAASLQIS
jgi:hypothetical protein